MCCVTAVLPDGTVTLLFSDIEGSTRMVHALGDAWPELLARQRELCRSAWAAYGGHELATEGDSFFVVFAEAADAVAAAVEAQSRLAADTWPDGIAVRVRIGLHTGSPVRLEDGYAGLDVHRGSRVSGAAHGGQVLVSEATLVAAGLTDGADLGWHQLEGLPDRMHLFQVVAEGLERDFPPIRSRGSLGGLPVVDGPILGRGAEVDELSRLLAAGTRVVTLTGPGGSGKTRLATEVAARVADRYADGVFFVPLVGAADGDEARTEVGRALGVTGDPCAQVADLAALLVLDNLEQCAGADELVASLLAAGRSLSVVATSRRPLHVAGEHELAVTPLAIEDASAMFAERAARVRRGFELTEANAEDVAAIVRQLDRLPLAIEIAAARTKMLSPAALAARVDDLMDLIAHGRDTRQRTVRATIAWSYDLLDHVQQRVLDCLGVFVDGAPLPGLLQVTAAEDLEGRALLDVLFELVDASLVQVTDVEDGEPRFSLLETVRLFACQRLEERGVWEDRQARHAQYYYDVTTRHWDDRQKLNHARNRAEHLREAGNLRAVVTRGARGVRHPEFYGDGEVPPAHVVALLANIAGGAAFQRYAESRAWAHAGLALPSVDGPARASLTFALGHLVARAGNGPEALAWLEGTVRVASTLGAPDLPSWVDPACQHFLSHREIAHVHLDLGDVEQARAACDRMLALPPPPGHERLVVHELPYFIAVDAGDLEAARFHLEREGDLIDELGVERERLLWANNMADLDVQMGRHADARRRLAVHCEGYLAQGDVDLLQYVLSTFASALGPTDPVLSARAFGAADRIRDDEGLPIPDRELPFIEADMAVPRRTLGPTRWAAEFAAGRELDVATLMRSLAAVRS